MSYNRKELKVTERKQDKRDPFRNDMIYDPMGQWAHPGQPTRIPGGNITMAGVPYPVMGIADTGQQQMMMPGQNYSFPGAQYVDELPMAQNGYADSLALYKAYMGQKEIMQRPYVDAYGKITKTTKPEPKKTSPFRIKTYGDWGIDDWERTVRFDNDARTPDHLKSSTWWGSQNSKDVIELYEKLGLTNRPDLARIAYYNSPDIFSDKIKPVGTYWDGSAYSPIYPKPVSPPKKVIRKPPPPVKLDTLPLETIEQGLPELLPFMGGEQEVGFKPPKSVAMWKQDPNTGTWYQIERPVRPEYLDTQKVGFYEYGGDLPKAQTGTYTTSNYDEYLRRKQAYQDSLDLFNYYKLQSTLAGQNKLFNRFNTLYNSELDNLDYFDKTGIYMMPKPGEDHSLLTGRAKKAAINRVGKPETKVDKVLLNYLESLNNPNIQFYNRNSPDPIHRSIRPIGGYHERSGATNLIWDEPKQKVQFAGKAKEKEVSSDNKTIRKPLPPSKLDLLPLEQIDQPLPDLELMSIDNKRSQENVKPPKSIVSWHQDPVTGTWYQRERPVAPHLLPSEKPGFIGVAGQEESEIPWWYMLPKAQSGTDTDYFKLSPASLMGQTPGLETYGQDRLTMDATFGRSNLAPRFAKRSSFESIGANLTARLPYQNNTGVGVQGNVKLVGDRWKALQDKTKANTEMDFTGGYDPIIGGYGTFTASPQFTFGNVSPTMAKVYGNQLGQGEWIAKAGPYGGVGWTPGREKIEERFNIPAGVKGQFNVGIGGGKTLGASGYFGGDLFGQASSAQGDPSGLLGRTHYGFDVNLAIPFGRTQKRRVGEAFTKLYDKAFPEEVTRPSIADRRSTPSIFQDGGEFEERELTDAEIADLRAQGYVVEEIPQAQQGTIKVSDPSDPRLHMYLDSLNLYNASQKALNVLGDQGNRSTENLESFYKGAIGKDPDTRYYTSKADYDEAQAARARLKNKYQINDNIDYDVWKQRWDEMENDPSFKDVYPDMDAAINRSVFEQTMASPKDMRLIDYYDQMSFYQPAVSGYWNTPDLGHSTILPEMSFVGDDAWNPLYAKPKQPYAYTGDPKDLEKYRDKIMWSGTNREWKGAGKAKPKGTTDPNISVSVRFRKMGLDSSFANRKKIAQEMAGIENYKGTSEQNKALNKWIVENYDPETKSYKQPEPVVIPEDVQQPAVITGTPDQTQPAQNIVPEQPQNSDTVPTGHYEIYYENHPQLGYPVQKRRWVPDTLKLSTGTYTQKKYGGSYNIGDEITEEEAMRLRALGYDIEEF